MVGKKSKPAEVGPPSGRIREDPMYVLLIGSTGAGKSTLVNTMVNHFRAPVDCQTRLPTKDELLVAIPTAHLEANQPEASQARERCAENRLESQSTECVKYSFDLSTEMSSAREVIIVDTPGLSDTRGTESDSENVNKILQLVESLPELHAIVLVVNGSNPRLTTDVVNTFNLLKGTLPDSVTQNTMAVLTMCSQLSSNLQLSTLPVAVKPEHVFFMQNSAFSTNPERWLKGKGGYKELQREWTQSHRTLHKLTKAVAAMAPTSTKAFKDLRELRDKIKTKMAAALNELRNMQALEDMLEKAQIFKKGAEVDMEKYKKFTQTKSITAKELVDAPFHSTLCSTCEHVCHQQCGLAEITTPGDPGFGGCVAFSGSTQCSQCERHCGVSTHYHARKLYQQTTKSVNSVLQDIKAKHEAAAKQLAAAGQDMSKSQGDMDILKVAQQAKLEEIKKLCKAVKQMCSGFNLVDEVQTVLDSLKKQARSLQSVAARATAQETIDSISLFLSDLARDYDPSTRPANTYVYDEVTVEELDLSSSDDEDTQPAAAARGWQAPSLAWRAGSQDSVETIPVRPAAGFQSRPCIYFPQGRCRKGDQCTFSHDMSSPAPPGRSPHMSAYSDAAAGPGSQHYGAPPAQPQGPLRYLWNRIRPGNSAPQAAHSPAPAPFRPQAAGAEPGMHKYTGGVRVLPHQAHRIGALIGPGGSNIKQLTRETATHVNIPKERSTAFNIDVTANSPADLARAMEIINDVLNGGQEGGTSQPGQEGWLTVQGIQQMRAHTASRY